MAQPQHDEESDMEYLIPAPVLTSADKLFNFGFVAFSVAQMIEMMAVLGVVYLLWSFLSFLPWQALLVVSVLLVAISFIFVTQPINGLPGDTWIKYTLRYYVLERSRHLLQRKGFNVVRLTGLRLVTSDGRTALTLGQFAEQNEAQDV